ncbi:elongator complex protein 6 isoform 3-T3 [Chlamydotis macqueenii]
MAASWCTISSPSTSELAVRFALWPCSSPSVTITSSHRSWAALCACGMHRLYGPGAPEVTSSSVLWLRCAEVLQAEPPVDLEGHLNALASGPSHLFEPSEEPQALSAFLRISFPCLTAAKERGQLVFLEGLKSCLDLMFGEEEEQPGQPSPLQFISESASNLKALFDFVRTSLTPEGSDSWKSPVLLVDDLSVLLSLGARPVAVLDFIHYCRVAVCSQLKGNIVVLVHSNEDSEDEENELVVNSMCHHSDLILWVEGLATGFCKDVHGQIKIIQRLSLELTGEQDRVRIYQYKIQDKNVTFFARGLSAAVL